jgi:hypothetical protein
MKFSLKKNYLIKGKHSPELRQKSSKPSKSNKVSPSPMEDDHQIATSHNNFSTSIEEPDPEFSQPPLSPYKQKLANGSAKIVNNRESIKNQNSRGS